MILPSAMRLITLEPTRRERMGIVTALGLSLYLVKVIHSPFAFTYSDDFLTQIRSYKMGSSLPQIPSCRPLPSFLVCQRWLPHLRRLAA